MSITAKIFYGLAVKLLTINKLDTARVVTYEKIWKLKSSFC